jgi:hypothetical protein
VANKESRKHLGDIDRFRRFRQNCGPGPNLGNRPKNGQ